MGSICFIYESVNPILRSAKISDPQNLEDNPGEGVIRVARGIRNERAEIRVTKPNTISRICRVNMTMWGQMTRFIVVDTYLHEWTRFFWATGNPTQNISTLLGQPGEPGAMLFNVIKVFSQEFLKRYSLKWYLPINFKNYISTYLPYPRANKMTCFWLVYLRTHFNTAAR